MATPDPFKPRISAVMPCLNEEATLALCIQKAKKAFLDLGIKGEVVVADNGSTDRSVAIAMEQGARVVHQPIPGYGAALIAGIEAAKADVIVMADADDSYDWSNLGPFLEKIAEGYDLVMGNRFKGGISPKAMPPLHRYLGNPVLSFIARLVCKAPIGDFHCGMRAFTKSAYQRMQIDTTGMEFASEMVINATRNGLKITEIPIRLYPDKRAHPPHLRSLRDGWRHLRLIMTYAPDQVFLWPGMIMLVIGIGLMGLLASGPLIYGHLHLGIHFLALGAMLTLTGFNILSLGLVGKVIMSQKHPKLKSRFLNWVKRQFTLEWGLIFGGLLMTAGLITDSAILWKWLGQVGQPMEATVHPAFVASTAIILGINIMHSAFLVNLILREDGALK